MLDQAVHSVLTGTALTAVLALPLLVWQYRRYGAPSATRLAMTGVTLVYASAIAAYTLFPLPANLSPEFCAARGAPIVLDPLEYLRWMRRDLAGLGFAEAMHTSVVVQLFLNVALFVPFGVLGRRFAGWSAPVTIAAGLATSLLVEATQYTGLWYLMPCSYRLADVNDLITNTTGAALGVALAAVLPLRLAPTGDLAATRLLPRPVTRRRRWFALLLDGWYVALAGGAASALVLTTAWVLHDGGPELGDEAQALLGGALRVVVGLAVALVTLLPALLGRGDSLGRRTTYLCLSGARPGQARLATALPGLAVLVLVVDPGGWGILAFLALLAEAASVAVDPRGLSGRLTGCTLADSRDAEPRGPLGSRVPERPKALAPVA